MTVDTLLPGVEASKAQIESLTLGDSLHRITSLLFIFGNFALRQKKINRIWFFYYHKGVLCRKEPPWDDGIDGFRGIIGRRRRALIQV